MKKKAIVFFLIAALTASSSVYAGDISQAQIIQTDDEASVEIEAGDSLEEENSDIAGSSAKTENAEAAMESADFTEADDNEDFTDSVGESVTSDGFEYEEYDDHIVISGYSGTEKENLVLPEKINGKQVTTFKDAAFRDLYSTLISVKMPGIERIPGSCFQHCYKLKYVEMPNAVTIGSTAFMYCDALEEVDMPKVTYIENDAFYACKNLKKVNIPVAEKICSQAFSFCTSLQDLYMPKVILVEKGTFKGCSDLESIDLPAVERIESEAFKECTGLSDIQFSKSISFIGDDAFVNCYKMNSIIIPGEGVSIGAKAVGYDNDGNLYYTGNYKKASVFTIYGVSGSESENYAVTNGFDFVPLGESVTPTPTPGGSSSAGSTGTYEGLEYQEYRDGTLSITGYSGEKESITIPEKIDGKRVTSIAAEGFSFQENLVNIKMPGIENIAPMAFSSCSKLKEIDAPLVMVISAYVFNGCSSLEKVEFPAATSIEEGGFTDCTALKEIGIPLVKYIGWRAFLGCSSLEKIVLSSVVEINREAFLNCIKLKAVTLSKAIEKINSSAIGYAADGNVWAAYPAPVLYKYSTPVTIYGTTGSAAESYAVDNGITFVSLDTTVTPIPTQVAALATPKLGKASSAGTKKIKVTWSKVANADGYRVYVKLNGKWKGLGNTTTASYTYTKAVPGQSYTFTVRAFKKTSSGNIWSGYNKTGITGKSAVTIPALKTAKASGTKAAVTWKKVSDAAGYAVYRKTGSGTWKRVGTVTKGTSFTDKNLKKGTVYTYTVRAYIKVSGKNVYSGYDKKGLSVRIK